MNIVVDYGHCLSGADTGAGANGYREENCTREIGNEVVMKLNALGHTVTSIDLSYSNSVRESLNKRIEIINRINPDISISIHLNAGGGHGTEIYTDGYTNDKADKILAEFISLGFRNRGIKDGYHLALVGSVKCYAMLVECCFIDTDDIGKYNVENFANAIVKGLTGQIAPSLKPKASLAALNVYDDLIEGNKIRLHAISNTADTEFRFHVRDPRGEWMCIRDYEEGSIYPYILRDNGEYRMAVYARVKGSCEDYEDYAYQDITVKTRDKALLNKLNIGTPKLEKETKLHAIANSSDTEFSFHVRINGVWSTIREYTDSSVCPYVPKSKGNYRFVVHARKQGLEVDYDDYKFVDVVI